ncbi:phage antirepressor KilAC domain-containing protein [Antrihabitans sp. NCIMB 15449]|uniref:Phage antirepressor KilAC domain-containing protein n=1 Tax=Antrihabitans spumae TaxID=3373370 RepID=A0ABW7JMK0_9NOCA
MSEIDITAPEARSQRDALTERTDVLDKVGVLRTLPDDLHVTTPMVAEFYAVDIDAVRQVVSRNREELDEDGYRVVSRSEFESDIASLSNLDPKVRSVALFPRRAVLRIGMLLRDSAVARQVRDYLLNVENLTPLDMRVLAESLKPADWARMVLQVEEEKSVLAAALESATPAIAYHDRHVAEHDDVVTIENWGHLFGLTEPQAFNLLRDKKLIYKHKIGQRWSNSKSRVEEIYEHRAYAGCLEWFEVRPQHNAPRHHNNQVRMTLYVKVFFSDEIARKAGVTRVSSGDAA